MTSHLLMFVNLYRALIVLRRHRVQRVDGVGVGELVELEVLHGVDQHALVQLLSQSEVSIAALDQSGGGITWSSRYF